LSRTTKGNLIQNPLVGIANKAMADMVRYAAEFGMTPSARTRLGTPAAVRPRDPAEDYFTS
jgi:P27 family predicted phage terminase small subunit